MLGQDTVVFLLYDWPYSLWPITREHQEEKRLRLFKPRFDAKECKWWIINKLLKLLCFFWGEISISGSGHIRLGKTQERGAAGAKWVLGHICLTFWGPLVPYPYFMCVQLGLWIVLSHWNQTSKFGSQKFNLLLGQEILFCLSVHGKSRAVAASAIIQHFLGQFAAVQSTVVKQSLSQFQSTATNCFWPTKNTQMIRVGILTSKRSIFSTATSSAWCGFSNESRHQVGRENVASFCPIVVCTACIFGG